jgi:hypothetical protein
MTESPLFAEAVDALRKTHDEILTGGAVGVAKITVPTSFISAGAIAYVSPVGAAVLAGNGEFQNGELALRKWIF